MIIGLLCCAKMLFSQTWVDTLDTYARKEYLPPCKYMWLWTDAALLNTFIKEYDLSPPDKKEVYLDYVKKAICRTNPVANGRTPNDVASAMGLAFLYRVTKEEKYKAKAEKIYAQYLKIRRTKEGGVSHIRLFTELWDDTIFMIGQFLLNMYAATGDEKYLDELVKQIRLHREKLQDKKWGLWYHGWDGDYKNHVTMFSQRYWPDKVTGRSAEMWGRGNGWIIVTLSDALETIPQSNHYYNELAGYLKEMIQHLPELQDKKTGHWYQLPVRNTDSSNFIESSCTAMFGYGISAALRLGIVNDTTYHNSVKRAYYGLPKYSLVPVKGGYLTTQNVCSATCIGNKDYYFKRAVKTGRPYAIGMFIQFGWRYELDNGLRNPGNKKK
ncbi:MAG TPA: glycoside hydrolase family 88 protein [Chitinophagales bacterium]|nr:glycoside hydrolase family 88 protein [Chitinophagales bacterium]